MKNLIRRFCYYILKLIGVDADIHIQENGNWHFFVTRNYNDLPKREIVLPIQYNDVIRDYRVIEVRCIGNANPIIQVELIADRPEIKAEEPVEYKTVGRMATFFKNLLSKKK